MGFRIPKRTALLVLHGDYEGGEARASLDISMEDYLVIKRWRSNETEQDEERALRFFADKILVGWNLEDADGAPVPCTGDGMMRIPLVLAVDILGAWQGYVESIPAPLAEPSADGLRLAEASTPMATESASRPS